VKRSEERQRDWLVDLGRQVSRRLRSRIAVPSVAIESSSAIRAFQSDADGWFIELGHIRPDRGSGLQLWLDRWPRTSTRKLWFGYKGTRQEQIRIAAAAGTPEFGPAHKLHDGAFAFDREESALLLRKPLVDYGKPVAEFYTDTWAFYGVYLRQTPRFARRASSGFVSRAAAFLEHVALGVASQLQLRRARRSTTAFEGHPRYQEHLVRERSVRLANEAKVRDGFTCRVCGINFEQLYGSIGHASAEAHHVIGLGRLVKARRNSADDLATVCANCHRMLHRLPATSPGLHVLKRRFTAAWPAS